MPVFKNTSGPALSVGKKDSAVGRGCLIFFFGLFALAESAMFWWMVVRPLWGVATAQAWTETPCTIVSSEVEVHGGDGDTYSIEIKYDYEFNGQQFRGERYHFMDGGASSGRAGKQAVVDQYPVGLKTMCWVDPGDLPQSVINRGLTLDMLWGCFRCRFWPLATGACCLPPGSSERRSSCNRLQAHAPARCRRPMTSANLPSRRTTRRSTTNSPVPTGLSRSSRPCRRWRSSSA
ncbi:MAG: DUF3592 domain-containing protein [Planctomycetaceae bacterium]